MSAKKTITVKIRETKPPHNVRKVKGYMPFKLYGEKFAVTAVLMPSYSVSKWKVTHIETGAAIPGSGGMTKQEAIAAAVNQIELAGKAKLREAIALTKAKITKYSPNK